jgi:tripartite-type tricarboxylate transporter receptor subunit TctC
MAIPIVTRLNADINECLKSSDVNAVLKKLALEPKVTTPQEFTAFVAAEMQKLPPIVRAAGLKPE